MEFVANKISTFSELTSYYLIKGSKKGLFESPRIYPLSKLDEASSIALRIKNWDAEEVNQKIIQKLESKAFTNHYSSYNKENTWSAVTLRGYSPDPGFICKPSEMSKKWQKQHEGEYFALQDTPLMDEFPEVQKFHMRFFKELGCEFQRVRFMRLEPGNGELERHTDQVDRQLGTQVGSIMRFHFPIQTNKDVLFSYWDYNTGEEKKFHMDIHRVHYLDIRKPHRAINGGKQPRIHLVIDVVVTQKLIDRLHLQSRSAYKL